MRKSEAARRSSSLDHLFAERQIYVRSGLTSRYVVVSRPLQIGVTLGAGLIVAWLAFASYSSVANRLEAAELSREVVRLETLNESLRAAAEAAPGAEHLQTLAARVPELEAALAAGSDGTDAEIEQLTRRIQASDAEAQRLRGDLEAALDDAAALRRTAETAEADLAALQAEMAQLREQLPAAGEAVADLEELKAPDAAPGDEVAELEADLVAAETRIAALTADLEQAKNELDAAREGPAADAGAAERAATGQGEVMRMRAELGEARQRIDELETALRQPLVNPVPLPPPPAPR